MKLYSLVIILFITSISFGQVKLQPKTFDNGFKYPHVVLAEGKSFEDSINGKILENISDLEASDFCIGEYGFVQKGSHIEIHLFCTCIDLDESEHRYMLFNIETGQQVNHDDLFAPKEKDKALALLNKKIDAYQSAQQSCKVDFDALNPEVKFEDLNIRMYKDGIEIRPKNASNCETSPLRVTWTELSTHLRHNFI